MVWVLQQLLLKQVADMLIEIQTIQTTNKSKFIWRILHHMDLVGHTNNVYDVTESPVVNTAMAAQIGINTPSITEEHPRINYRRTNAFLNN